MAILANLPFCLEVRKKSLDDQNYENLVLKDFFETVLDLKQQHKPELRILENRNLSIRLTSTNMDAALDMDGFDGLDNPDIAHADGTYLKSSYSFVQVFSGESFPLPPGLYVLKVTVNDKEYYTGFEVVSSVMGDNGIWKAMVADIMDCIPRQVVDYAYIRSVAKQFAYNEVTPHMLWKMLVLNEGYARVIAALNDIRNNPHNRLIKRYKLHGCRNRREIDARSKRLNASKYHPANKEFVPQKELSFDLLENRYLKRILLDLSNRMQQCLDEASSDMLTVADDLKNVKYEGDKKLPEYIRKRKVSSFLLSQCTKIESLKTSINALMQVQWIKELPAFQEPVISTQNFSDPRYNVIFSLYSKLDRIAREYSSDKHMTLLWKRTSLMYEYWNIILLVKSIMNNGFTLQSSDAAQMTDRGIIFSELVAGCNFSFRSSNGEYVLKLYYEKEIPRVDFYVVDKQQAEKDAQDRTSKCDQPLYTKKANNTPDCIIDCYECDEFKQEKFYLGSLIIDFKYRKRSSLWNDNQEYVYKDFRNTGYEYDSCANQFKAYKDMRTIFFGDCDGLGDNISDRFIKPVHEVWALYPNVENPKSVEFKSGYGIRFVPSIPGNEDVLQKQLKNFLEWLMPGLT